MEIRDRSTLSPLRPAPPAREAAPRDRFVRSDPPIPAPPIRQLAADRQLRARQLLEAMIQAPNPQVQRIVVDQLMAYGPAAIEKVHNHGTQIIVVPHHQDPQVAWREISLTEQNARDLKQDTGGLYDPIGNRIFLREDMISDGLTAQRSAVINRHEFAHALASALGGEAPLEPAWEQAKTPVTAYARTNLAEYFAESVAGYLSPAASWSEHRTFGQKLAWGLFDAFQGFCIPTQEGLQKRDPKAFQAVRDLMARLPQMPLSRHAGGRGGDRLAWLWRAHQVDPDDEKVRIELLTQLQKNTADPRPLEADVNAAYARLHARPVQRRQDLFKRLDLYCEQAARPLADQARLDRDAAGLAPQLLQFDGDRKDPNSRWNAAQDYDMVERNLRQAGLDTAADAFRQAQDRLLTV